MPARNRTIAQLKWIVVALALSLLLVEGVYRFSPLVTAEHAYSDLCALHPAACGARGGG
jgi:hypothetical protein